MTGVILNNTLRSSWKQVLYWGLGMGLMGIYIVFISSNSDIIEGYAKLFESLPPAMLQAFGASDAAMFSTTEGWVVSIFVSEASLILSIHAVIAGMNIAANEEQAGIMDMIMAMPISRTQFIVEKSIAYALISLGIILCSVAFPVLALIAFGVDADLGVVASSILNLYPGLLLVTTVTSLLATILRRRSIAVGLAAAFVVGSYIFNVIGNSASGAIADLMQQLSFFYHASGGDIILGTFDPAGTLGVIAVVLICFAASISMFNRRDLGL